MHEASDFWREITAREGLDSSCVVPALASSDSEELRELWARDAAQFGFAGYNHGIILEEGDRNLFTVLVQEVLSFDATRAMLREILCCIKPRHDQGVAHADIKPLNVSCGGISPLVDVTQARRFTDHAPHQRRPSAHRPRRKRSNR